MLNNRADAYHLLRQLNASTRLLLHVRLVAEAADILMNAFRELALHFDTQLIELGVAIHDAGKILYPQELVASGALHELAGETLLLTHGVQPNVARCCVTHAAWAGAEVSLEERTVALADKLWKGKREVSLELCVIDDVALQLGIDRWDIYERLDTVFESIAAEGDARLQRSRE